MGGLFGGKSSSAPAPKKEEPVEVVSKADEMSAARRRARQSGRALLSDTRLNPEAGVGQTLGAGPMQ